MDLRGKLMENFILIDGWMKDFTLNEQTDGKVWFSFIIDLGVYNKWKMFIIKSRRD